MVCIGFDFGSTTVNVKITGLAPGPHGIHLHKFGDTMNGCISTGWIYFGYFLFVNLWYSSGGGNNSRYLVLSSLCFLIMQIPLSGSNVVIGRALVHELQDDLGKGGHELSLSTGNDGGRLACGLPSSFPASSINFNDQRSSAMFGLQHENHFDKVPGSCNLRSMFSYQGYYPNPLSDLPSQEVAFGINYNHNNSGFHVPYNFSSMNRPCMNDALFHSHQNPMDFDHLAQSLVPLSSQNQMHHSLPIFNGSQEAATNAWVSQYPSAMRSMGNLKAFTCEDGLIMQGEDMNYVMKNRFDP
ncbi:hypothetical protein GIB67_011526 [Kingdonia uniflora]|uniref:Superoxide dismutase copper/zinc binding domain-containing protein n=1 Tax=Kingdonia uniflora TaxID=39325 RepID=A0A7J7NLN2_9MAGN|nr:hypothetical protein GIB67_011526 [Kingdonia uniflora]